jgi:hypothetical protein
VLMMVLGVLVAGGEADAEGDASAACELGEEEGADDGAGGVGDEPDIDEDGVGADEGA